MPKICPGIMKGLEIKHNLNTKDMPDREADERRYRERQAADNKLVNIVVITGLIIMVLLGMLLGDH